MALQSLNRGLTPNTPVSDDLWTATEKINDNFTYLDEKIDAVVATIDQDNIDIRKYFWIYDGDTPAQMLARINALANYTVSEKQSVWFVGNQMAEPVEIGEIPPLPRTVKFKMMNKGKGTYGTGGTALTLSDLELVYDNGATAGDIETAPSTDVHDFGNIGTLAVEDWLNEQNPAIEIQSQASGYTLFKGTIDGNAVSYLWLGAAGTYGDGALQAAAADFQLLEETVPAVDQNNLGRKMFIGFVENEPVIFEVVDKLNAISFTIGEKETPVLITALKVVDGIATQKLTYQWMAGKGVFGLGGTEVTFANLFGHTPEAILPGDVQDDDYTVLIALNEIAEGGFLAAANAEERDLSDAGLEYFFTYIFDDVTYLVQFIGVNGIYGGGGTPLVAEDFTQISDTNTPPVVVPNLQQVMEQGSVAEVDTDIFLQRNNGADSTSLGLGATTAMLSAGEGRLTMNGTAADITVPLAGPAATGPAHYVRKDQVDVAILGTVSGVSGYGVNNANPRTPVIYEVKNLTDDIFASVMAGTVSSPKPYITYLTDTFRQLDLGATLTPLGVNFVTANEVVRNGNDLFVYGNNRLESSSIPDILIKLKNCRITNNVISFDSLEYKQTISVGVRIHSMKYHRGFIFMAQRPDNAANPTTVYKINANNLNDVKSLTLPTTTDYLRNTNELLTYKNKIYVYFSERVTNGAHFVEIDENLNNVRVLFTGDADNTKRPTSNTPFLIYNDNIYITINDNTSNTTKQNTIGIAKYTMEGVLVSAVNSALATPSAAGGLIPHWMTVYNGKIVVTCSTDRMLRFDVNTLALEEEYPLPENITDDNTVRLNGLIYLNGETSFTTGKLYSVMYNDFAGTFQSVLTPYFSAGSLMYEPTKESLITRLSQLKNDLTLSKSDVGLSNVDNTSDAAKPISTAQAAAIAAKQDALVSGSNLKTLGGVSLLGSGDIAVPTITEYPETTYAQSETFSGTVPTGTAIKNWRGTQVGKKVSFRVNITYPNPGATITQVMIPFPTGLPTPSTVTGYSANNDYPISCIGFLNTGPGSQPPAARAYVRKTSSGHVIYIIAASGAYSGAMATVDYWTD